MPPGSTVDLSVSLTAPTAPGTYQGDWKLRNNGAQFRFFGAGTPTGAGCHRLALGSGGFDANSTTYCYRNRGGKYGYLKVDSAGFVLQLDWGTYTFP